ncbi:MAG: CHASE3 domain-containing protein [Isosphaeraceae bacterium]|nr:CHASE3 domain-containing protein [Isosphaeraceae bacterium]
MNRALPRIAKSAFALALAVLTANAVLTYRDVHALRTGVDRVARSHVVIAELRDTISTLQDAEIGQGSYLLTRDREHLERYRESVAALHPKFDRIAALTRENPRQQESVNRLRALVVGRVGELKCALWRFEQHGRTTEAEADLLRRKTNLTETARELFGRMEREEECVLAERSSAYQKAADRTIASSVITTGTAGGLLLAVAFLACKLAPVETPAGSPWSGRRSRPLVRCRSDKAASRDNRSRTAMTDNDVDVLIVIAVAILGLCAVLLVVSRL